MNNKQKYVAIPLAIVMMPFILLGLVGGFVWRYVEAGHGLFEMIDNEIAEWVSK